MRHERTEDVQLDKVDARAGGHMHREPAQSTLPIVGRLAARYPAAVFAGGGGAIAVVVAHEARTEQVHPPHVIGARLLLHPGRWWWRRRRWS